jgi:hypothetical protein
VLSNIGGSLIGYLTSQTSDGKTANSDAASQASSVADKAVKSGMQAAIQRAAGSAKTSAATQHLDDAQKALAGDMRLAMKNAGLGLKGAVEFSVTSKGAVEIKGSDSDKAAVKSFFNADSSKPSFASRIASLAGQALPLSGAIQQSAAISQAAKYAKSASSVMSLYSSMLQQTPATTVVFSLSAASSSLTYPGSLVTTA